MNLSTAVYSCSQISVYNPFTEHDMLTSESHFVLLLNSHVIGQDPCFFYVKKQGSLRSMCLRNKDIQF